MVDRQAAIQNTLLAAQLVKMWYAAADKEPTAKKDMTDFLESCTSVGVSSMDLLEGALTVAVLFMKQGELRDIDMDEILNKIILTYSLAE